MQPEDVAKQPYTYMGVTAPVALWVSAGLEFKNYGETFSLELPNPISLRGDALTPGEVMEASIHTGDSGEKAIVWLIQERRRRKEEEARIRSEYESRLAHKKAGDDAIHAARIRRQAAELECLARGINGNAINARLT